jgi:hypothetical protein
LIEGLGTIASDLTGAKGGRWIGGSSDRHEFDVWYQKKDSEDTKPDLLRCG